MRRSVTSQDEEEKLKDLLGVSAKAGRYLSLQEIPIDRTKSADLWVVEKLRNYKLIGSGASVYNLFQRLGKTAFCKRWNTFSRNRRRADLIFKESLSRL